MGLRKNKVKLTWCPKLAYVIGVMATDGNLSPDLRHLNITSKDREMLVNCKKCLSIDNKIGKKSRKKNNNKEYFVLQFGDVNFFDFLLSIGLTPNKSKTISALDIPSTYFPHFFRGCIDGDGNISIFKHPESKRPQVSLRICSASNKFLEWLLSKSKVIYQVEGGTVSKLYSSSVYTLRYGKEDSKRILKMTYLKNMICLSRKKEMVSKALGEWRNW